MVLAFDVVELQRPGDRVEHALRRSADVPALELRVVVQAHPGQPCDLFAAEAGHAALVAEVGQAGLRKGDGA